MGGVDHLDSLIALYRTKIRSRKWYHRIVFHMLNLTAVEAWLLYRRVLKMTNQDKQTTMHCRPRTFCLFCISQNDQPERMWFTKSMLSKPKEKKKKKNQNTGLRVKLIWLCSFHKNNQQCTSKSTVEGEILHPLICKWLILTSFQNVKTEKLVYLATRQQSDHKTSYNKTQGIS